MRKLERRLEGLFGRWWLNRLIFRAGAGRRCWTCFARNGDPHEPCRSWCPRMKVDRAYHGSGAIFLGWPG